MNQLFRIGMVHLMCSMFTLFSQKRSLVPMAISCEMIHEVEIPIKLKNYKSEIITNIYTEMDLEDAARRMLRLPAHGYHQNDQNPDFKIILTANDFEIIRFNENLARATGKDIVLNYSFAPVLKIQNSKGEEMYSKILKNEESKVMTRNEFFNFQEIYSAFITHKSQPEKIQELILSHKMEIGYWILAETIKEASVFLETCMFDQTFTFESSFCTAKHNFDYSNLQNSVTTSTEAIMSLMESSPKKRKSVAEVSKVLKGYIELWEGLLKEENFTNDNARINNEIAQGLCMNLAFAYFMNNDIRTAISYSYRLPIPKNGEIEAEGSFKYGVLQLRKMLLLFNLYNSKIKISGS